MGFERRVGTLTKTGTHQQCETAPSLPGALDWHATQLLLVWTHLCSGAPGSITVHTPHTHDCLDGGASDEDAGHQADHLLDLDVLPAREPWAHMSWRSSAGLHLRPGAD